jgi:hypothetical protein
MQTTMEGYCTVPKQNIYEQDIDKKTKTTKLASSKCDDIAMEQQSYTQRSTSPPRQIIVGECSWSEWFGEDTLRKIGRSKMVGRIVGDVLQ